MNLNIDKYRNDLQALRDNIAKRPPTIPRRLEMLLREAEDEATRELKRLGRS